MVIGLLTLTSIPTITGVGQAVSAQKRQNAASKEQEKFNLKVSLPNGEGVYEETADCVLRDGKLIASMPSAPVQGHDFCGFYFKYPSEEGHLGLVSTIADDTPMLNWIYVNHDTQAMQYGPRRDTVSQNIGPWGFSDDETLLTLDENADGFIVRREIYEGLKRWVIHWDPEQCILAGAGTETCTPCSLRRRPLLGVESSYVKDDD